MDPDRWRRISLLYHEARARPAEERLAFLDASCGDDAVLRQELDVLLADDTHAAETFLATPGAPASSPGRSATETAGDCLAPGTILDQYRIEHLLGRGGMGVVYLAYDTRLRRRVALKVLASDADAAASSNRILREARNAAGLNHPHVCTVYEVGNAGGVAFIAMEYVSGRSLRDRIDEGSLALQDVLRLGAEAADALGYAHAHGVVHRDFKAANAILTEDGRLKIADFGLARRSDAVLASGTTMASLVPAGTAAGTPYAMAPEQVCGEPADPRTDLWALGVLLYEMVTGTVPFTGATVHQLFAAILTQPPPALPRDVPIELRALIGRCLEKDPAHRYQGASEVRAALEAIQAGTVAPWVAWRYHARRRPLLAGATAALATAMVLVGLTVGDVRDRLVGTPPAPPPIKLAVLPFENLTGDPEQEYLSDGLTEEMIGELGRLHPGRLGVIARTSAMRYKGTGTPIDEIGRALGVDYVLEGSARREGNRVRIRATLIHVHDQTQRWAETYDRELASVLAVQRDVARGVAEALALELLPEERTRLATARQVNPAAHEAYLKGRFHWYRMTAQDMALAQRYFEEALRIDPDYALAYVGLADAIATPGHAGQVPAADVFPEAKALVARALALDDRLAAAHDLHARMLGAYDWDWSGAEAAFQRAIELDPNYPDVRVVYAQHLSIVGRGEAALAEVERGLQLDPYNPWFQQQLARQLHFAGRHEEAIARMEELLAAQPGFRPAHGTLWGALFKQRRFDEAFGHLIASLGDTDDDW